MSSSEGFKTIEGLIAFFGLMMALILGAYGLKANVYLLALYIFGIALFFSIYATKLCKACTKNCPCNPNLKFWKKCFNKG